MLGDFAAQAHQQSSAFGGIEFAPVAVKPLARGLDCSVDIAGIAALNVFKGLAIRRVQY
jgi:hypothetical protein